MPVYGDSRQAAGWRTRQSRRCLRAISAILIISNVLVASTLASDGPPSFSVNILQPWHHQPPQLPSQPLWRGAKGGAACACCQACNVGLFTRPISRGQPPPAVVRAAAAKPGVAAVSIAHGQPVAFSSPVRTALMSSIIGGLLVTKFSDTGVFASAATTFTLTSPGSPASPVSSGADVVLIALATDTFCRGVEVDAYRTALVCDAATAAGGLVMRFASGKLYYQGFPLVTGAPGQLAMFDFSGANFDLPFTALGACLGGQ
jgi:hypothetical protein